MSEDSSSDEDWCASADRLAVGADLGEKCWECGKRFQCIQRLMSHYKSHDVQATCHICKVTFRRMTSLSTHLDNAHSPHCKRCNQWFSNVWECNKHAETHSTSSAPFEGTPSHSYIIVSQDQNNDKFHNELTDSEMAPLSPSEDAPPNEGYTHVVADHTCNDSCGNDKAIQHQSTDTVSESRPLEIGEIKCGKPETGVDHIDYTLEIKDEFEDIKMENPYQTSDECENTDDSTSSGDTEMSLADGDERPSDVHGDEEEYVEEQSDDGTHTDTHSESDLCPDDPASDSGSHSSSTGSSSGSSSTLKYSNNPPSANRSMCTVCGKGPFRNVKIHLLHCTSRSKIFPCSACKGHFATEKFLHKHQMRLYSCDICGQVFSHWNSYKHHLCHKGSKSSSHTVRLYCSESMPKTCHICKAFFSTENSLLNHVITAHSSMVSTKVCIITKPSASTDKKMSPVVSATVAQLAASGSGHVLVSNHAATCQSPRAVNLIINGKPSAGQSYAGPLSAVVQSSPSSPSLSSSRPGLVPVTSRLLNGGVTKFMILQQTPPTVTQVVPQKSATNPQVTVMTQNNTHSRPPILSSQKMTTSEQSLLNTQPPASPSPVRPLPPILMAVPNTAVRSGTNSALGQGTNHPPGHRCTPASVPISATNKTPATVASQSVSPLTPPLNIVALFKNDSREVALMKRMNAGWRSKAPYPCRQCGAVSRQPSLIISHRYLHRGRRSHRCQCGRAFKHRLHLLRHCMQHAEATSYICVSCGETFTGAKLLTEHMKGNSRKSLSSGCSWKHRGRRKCSMPFSCDCGQLFLRPSAYIWHQLKNRTKAKHWKKPSK
ncbi:uncharacterized protein LOC144541911 [Centroberyx gerrardi]